MAKVLSVDIGGSYIKSALVDEKGKMEAKSRIPTPKDYDGLIAALAGLAAGLPEAPAGITAALPGGYDFEKDEIFAPNLPSINGRHIRADLEKAASLPVMAENDANLAALGEYVFIEQGGIRNMMFVTLGTGAGGGLIINGGLPVSAVTSFEIGHICVAPGGRLCGCGRKGCMDEYCTTAGLMAEYAAAGGGENISEPLELALLAEKGHKAAAAAFKSFAVYLARGLADAANLFCPEKIKLGGGLSELSRFFMADCSENFFAELFPMYRSRVKLEIAGLKNDAGILGGAACFFKGLRP